MALLFLILVGPAASFTNNFPRPPSQLQDGILIVGGPNPHHHHHHRVPPSSITTTRIYSSPSARVVGARQVVRESPPFVDIQGDDDYDPLKGRSFAYSLKNFYHRALECWAPPPQEQLTPSTKKDAKVLNKRVWDYYKRFFRECMKERAYLSVSFTALVIAAACEVAVPHYSSKALNAIIATRSLTEFNSAVRMVVILGVVASAMTFFRATIFGLAGIRLAARVRTVLFKNLLSQEMGFYDGRETGELTNRLSVDCSKLSTVISSHVNVLLRQTIQMMGGSVFLFQINGQLATITLLGIAFISLLTAVHGEFMRRMGKRSQDALARANAVAGQVLSLIRVVRSHGSEEIELKRYGHELRNTINLIETHDIGHSAYRSILRLLQTVLQAWVLGVGAYMTHKGCMTGEQLTSFLFYVNFVSAASFDVGDRWTSIQEAIGSTSSVFALMDRPSQLKVYPELAPEDESPSPTMVTMYEYSETAHPLGQTPAGQTGSIQFRDMTFAYPLRHNRPVFENFNLVIPPGQRTAIIGASGSGKSTLLRLMCRFYDPRSGSVQLDGRDLRSFTERELTRKIALLQQESQLFPLSIAENIAYGLDEGSYNMEDIVQAGKEANVHEFISTLPEKYMTRIGENAVTLSGGQRQRLAIARALIRRPEVLLLDEPTSALDIESERVVQEALDLAGQGRTVILVAHRLSTIKSVENIVVLKDGKVAEIGNHESLLAMNGVYASLVKTYREYVV